MQQLLHEVIVTIGKFNLYFPVTESPGGELFQVQDELIRILQILLSEYLVHLNN